jgi:hypothetical protein
MIKMKNIPICIETLSYHYYLPSREFSFVYSVYELERGTEREGVRDKETHAKDKERQKMEYLCLLLGKFMYDT